MDRPPFRHRILLCLLGLMLGSCSSGGGGPGDPASEPIARLGGREVSRGAFEAYLKASLGNAKEMLEAPPEVKSRLLDQFIEEELVIQAARREGLMVSDEELEGFLPDNEGDPERVRRVLLEKKYHEEVVLKDLEVTEEEIQDHFERNLRRFRRPARVVLRKILLDSAHEARNVRSVLIRRPDDFETVAEIHSLSPDGGKPQAYEEETLPESIRKVVVDLREGQISPVVEDPQGFFILRLEARQPERSQKLEEVWDRIELELLREKSERRLRDSVQALRRRTRVVILMDKLGFDYVKRDLS